MEHGTRGKTFDWSLEELPKEPEVQWGAFYSDCKHEVHKVSSGVRITVTYNLIAVLTSQPLLKVGTLALTYFCIPKQLCKDAVLVQVESSSIHRWSIGFEKYTNLQKVHTVAHASLLGDTTGHRS